jgi:hypothetical protein
MMDRHKNAQWVADLPDNGTRLSLVQLMEGIAERR